MAMQTREDVILDDLEWLGAWLEDSGSDSTPRDDACCFLSLLFVGRRLLNMTGQICQRWKLS